MASTFNLNEQINQYIANLNSSQSLTQEDLVELTSHLSDAVLALESKGLSTAEAFTIATMRLGDQQDLAREYKKVNGSSMLQKEWTFIFIGVAVAVIFFNLQTALEAYVTLRTMRGQMEMAHAAVLLSLFYALVLLLTIGLFKKQQLFSNWLKQNFFSGTKTAIAILSVVTGLLILLPLHKIIGITAPYSSQAQETLQQITRYHSSLEFIIRGTIPGVLMMGIFLSAQSVQRNPGWSSLLNSKQYAYIFLAAFGLETVSALAGRMLLPSLPAGPLISMSVIAAGTMAFYYHNRYGANPYIKTACFTAVPFFIELLASIFIRQSPDWQWTTSVLFWYFIATAAGAFAGFAGIKIFLKVDASKHQPAC